MGGCRMMRYGTFNEALSDVLRLSKGMTYKNIMAGLPYGGGNVGRIAGMLHELFVRADAEKLPSSMVADAMAQERLARRAERPRKSPRSLKPGAKPFNRFEFCQQSPITSHSPTSEAQASTFPSDLRCRKPPCFQPGMRLRD